MSNLPQNHTQSVNWVIITDNQLLVAKSESGLLRRAWSQLPFIHHHQENIELITTPNTEPFYMIDLGAEYIEEEGFEKISLRNLLMLVDIDNFEPVARAWQVAHFLRTHKYCGQCGKPMRRVSWELAMHCHSCHHRCYPRISPCIIVAVRKGDKMLLAQGKAHTQTNMYSTLAGFVESGETLEQAVHREVFEEVAIKVKNLRYFGSQPWPFPHSLMVGYIADYASGEIKIDDNEIVDANWYDIDDLPHIPHKFSIARDLIDHLCNAIKGA